jgi:hypothetical protein
MISLTMLSDRMLWSVCGSSESPMSVGLSDVATRIIIITFGITNRRHQTETQAQPSSYAARSAQQHAAAAAAAGASSSLITRGLRRRKIGKIALVSPFLFIWC